VLFSNYFPTETIRQVSKCRQFNRLYLNDRNLPRFRREFDSHRPLHNIKDLQPFAICCRNNREQIPTSKVIFGTRDLIRSANWDVHAAPPEVAVPGVRPPSVSFTRIYAVSVRTIRANRSVPGRREAGPEPYKVKPSFPTPSFNKTRCHTLDNVCDCGPITRGCEGRQS